MPMKLPWTKFPVAPEPKMSTPFRLPEITLAAAWVRAPDNVVGGGDPDTYSIAVVAQVGAAVDIRPYEVAFYDVAAIIGHVYPATRKTVDD